jgi:multiple sugar transport system permease protein
LQLSKQRIASNITGYIFAFPFIAFAAVFILYPMVKGIYNSFFSFGFGQIQFVGLENYTKVFTDNLYMLSIKNSLFFVFTVVPLIIVLGMVIAGSVFDKVSRYISFVRISLYIPVIASMVVMTIIWKFLLDSQCGLLRYFYDLLHMNPVNLLGDANWTFLLLIFILFSVNIGQAVVLYIACLIGIPKELLESLEIDGGSRWDLFHYILIPFAKPTTLFIFITQTAAVIRVFVVIQLLTNGGPNFSSTTMMYLLYQEGFSNGNFGSASALGVIMFLFSILLVFFQFISLKGNPEKGGIRAC